MANAKIKRGAKVKNAIIAPDTIIDEGERVNIHSQEIVLVNRR